MVPEAVKIFLNHEIRGDEVRGTKRLFHGAAKIKPPRYNSRYLETFPTVWAAAHEFQQLIKLASDKNADPAILKTAHEAVEEWVCLFLLHYSGVINPYVYKKDDKEKEKDDFRKYDHDLWTALRLTFPPGGLNSITLLRADDAAELGSGTVVGGYYPGIFFFPSRGRASWLTSDTLRPYLDGTRLSWERCLKSQLLKEPQDRLDFSTHLASIEKVLGDYKQTLEEFRASAIKASHLPQPNSTYSLGDSILTWKRQVIEDKDQLMNGYPLVWESEDQKQRTYLLVNDMPGEQEFWMSEAIGRGMPAPRNFSTDKEKKNVFIKHAGKTIRYELNKNEARLEKVVNLKDCFLSVNPFWCPIPSDDFPSRIRNVHRVSMKRQEPFSSLKEGEVAVCLAPINSVFLENCSAITMDGAQFLKTIEATIHKQQEEVDEADLDWSFVFQGRDGEKTVHWSTNVEQRTDVTNNAVALWPPRCSDDWHFYVARCFGSSKAKSGTWILVDENGRYDKKHKAFALDVTLQEGKTDVTEYVSHIPLAENPAAANKPRYLMLLDTDEKVERGVLFLDDSIIGKREKESDPSATLAVDFGTSNTGMALGIDTQRTPLVFSLSPVMLWGRQPTVELPGRVPFNWQGKKFYPTIFMSRKKSGVEQVQASQLVPGNLFQIDIPSLHSGMEDGVFSGKFDGWNLESNLKWKLKVEHNSYRQLFLALSLLYAHAEIFFGQPRGVQIKDYVFSFPLAFTSTEQNQYCQDAKVVAQVIRRLCYGEGEATYHKVDESTAIAADSDVAPNDSIVQVFIDVGGGTTDIAIRKGEDFPARDSIRVAGRTFFAFAEENFKRPVKESREFKINLSRLLLKLEKEFSLDTIRLDLGTFYSLAISRLDESDFRQREAVVLQKGMGNNSYQRYRSVVFFRHIIAYGLLQAFAAAVTNTSDVPVQSFQVVLAGNAWGLLLFAELKRRSMELKREAEGLFRFLKKSLLKTMEKEDESEDRTLRVTRLNSVESVTVKLLNEAVLSQAKTAVAMGALKAPTEEIVDEVTGDESLIDETIKKERAATGFAGLSLKNSKVNGLSLPIAWYDKWDLEHIKTRIQNLHQKELLGIQTFATGSIATVKEPFDNLLKAFVQIANVASYDDEVSLPEEKWQAINALLHQDRIYYRSQSELGTSPVNYFVGELLYPEDSEHEYMRDLANLNKSL